MTVESYSHEAPPLLAQAFPIILVMAPILIILYLLAQRKGKDYLPYLILGCIPLVNALALVWLASQTDAAIKAELEDLRRRLDEKAI